MPSENVANVVTPTSIPTAKSLAGSGLDVYSNTKVANHPETVRWVWSDLVWAGLPEETYAVFSAGSGASWGIHRL